MKLKKIPLYLLIGLLTIGASLTLGLLSFGGMFALWPILPLAFGAMFLSVAYEAQINLENIKDAFKKLFDPEKDTKRELAKQYLLEHFPDAKVKNRPKFFKDYEAQLHLLHSYTHKRLKNDRARIIQEKNLKHMEKWFVERFFSEDSLEKNPTKKYPFDLGKQTYIRYQNDLQSWLAGSDFYTTSEISPLFSDYAFEVVESIESSEKLNTYVWDKSQQKLFYIHANTEREEITVKSEFLKNLTAYESSNITAQDVLNWTENHEPVIRPYRNAYVYEKNTQNLYYFDQYGEPEIILIKEENKESFSQNINQIANQPFQHLTAPQIYRLTANQSLVNIVSDQERIKAKSSQRLGLKRIIRYGSFIAGAFMGLGTGYLLLEAFTIVPFLVALPAIIWPVFIVPLALLSGGAYALLTYNAVTDMLHNDTVRKWYKKLRDDLSQGRSIFLSIMAIFLFSLTLSLTICTAGTWWTITKHSISFLKWIGGLLPAVIGLSAMFFNLENTFETLSMLDEVSKTKSKSLWQMLKEGIQHIIATENIWQMLNPFRIILKLTITPLRILLFLGHLVSIGVTSDRLPGVPEIISALLGIISEGFEDAHYFFSAGDDTHNSDTQSLLKERLNSDHGHDHNMDIPTRVLYFIFSPIFILAAAWDSVASLQNSHDEVSERKVLSFWQALDKQWGLPIVEDFTLPEETVSPSRDWQKQHINYLIEKQCRKLDKVNFAPALAQQKQAELKKLQDAFVSMDFSKEEVWQNRLQEEQNKEIYKQQRFTPQFFDQPTETSEFMSQLGEKCKSPSANVNVDALSSRTWKCC